MGRSIASKEKIGQAARFKLGQNAFVIDADNRPVAPGSGIAGRVAVRGGVPIGYYKDPGKSAATFPEIRRRALRHPRATTPWSRPTAPSHCSGADR